MNGRNFPTADEYTLAQPCRRCGAPSGVECTVKRGRYRFHAPRLDRAIAHYHHDVDVAPWPQDRVPGRRYDTTYRGVTVPQENRT